MSKQMRKWAVAFLLLVTSVPGWAQLDSLSVRTNLLWDAAAEPNLGLEVPLSRRFSLGVDAGLKSWPRWWVGDTDAVNNPSHWRNFAVVPEARFYPDRVYEGWYVGADLVYTHFNVGNVKFPLGLYPQTREHRVQGDFLGVGILAGYSWWLGRHWRVEVQAGVAAGWAGYGLYRCEHCGEKLEDVSRAAFVPKLGVNIGWNPSARREETMDCGLPIPLKEVGSLPEAPDPSDQAARTAWEEQAARIREAEEWNAMAREHNIKVQECLNRQKQNKKNKNKNK